MTRKIAKRSDPIRKTRRRIITTKDERSLLNQIASLFDESEKAFSLLYRHINNGYICTPDKDLPILDFLKVHQEAWEKRQSSGIPNSIEFLRNSIVTWSKTVTSYGQPISLDETERIRDSMGQYEGKYGKYKYD